MAAATRDPNRVLLSELDRWWRSKRPSHKFMTLEEAEDSVLALKTLPQIEDADITFTDDGGYVVSAGLEGRTISFSSHEAFQEFFGRTWPDSLLTHAILGQNDVPIPCTHELYIQWYVAGGRSNCEKRRDEGDGWHVITMFQGSSGARDGPHLFWWVVGKLPNGDRLFEIFGTKEAALQYHQSIVDQIGRGERG